MTTKKAAKPASRATKPKVTEVTITANQALNFINRITAALETSNRIAESAHPPSDAPAEQMQQVQAPWPTSSHVAKGDALPPPSPPSVIQMVSVNFDVACGLNKMSKDLRERLYGPTPEGGENGCATASRGETKDTLASTRYQMEAAHANLAAIYEYLLP